MKRSEAGFTLVEITIAVGLIALMASIAGTAILPAMERARVEQAATTLADALRKAQISAVRERRMWRVVLDTDGRGFTMEYATSPSATTDCSAAGWQASTHMALPDSVAVTGRSRRCINFSSSGHTRLPLPIVDANVTNLPVNGLQSLMRIADGYRVDDQHVNDPAFNPRDNSAATAVWNDTMVTVLVDAQESRYFRSLCVGLVSYPDIQIGYPAWVVVDGMTASGTWIPLHEGPGQADPTEPDARAQICIPIPLDQELSQFLVTMTANSPKEIALDEVDLGDLFITLTGRGSSKQVLVSLVTGRVRVN